VAARLLDLRKLEATDVVAGCSVGRAAEKFGKGLNMPDIVVPVFSLKVRTVMSAIMRRRRSLIGLSLIEGSCPEVGVLDPQSSGRDARPVIAPRSFV
jgi:hypothetical protein